jgi:hypothetical protein
MYHTHDFFVAGGRWTSTASEISDEPTGIQFSASRKGRVKTPSPRHFFGQHHRKHVSHLAEAAAANRKRSIRYSVILLKEAII